jgi:hypothetical protein
VCVCVCVCVCVRSFVHALHLLDPLQEEKLKASR